MREIKRAVRFVSFLAMGWAGSVWMASADTFVGGAVSGQTWTKANSPYVVTNDILVASLTIQPGVTVFFQSDRMMEVAGRLTAIGTAQDKITFTLHPASSAGWRGLFFNQAPPVSQLAHCVVERSASSGIRIVSTTLAIRDCLIRGNTVSLPVSPSSEVLGGGINSDTALTLDNCVIEENAVTAAGTACAGKGGGVFCGSGLVLNRCVVQKNSVAVTATGGAVTAIGNGGGVCVSGQLAMTNSLISSNSVSARANGGLNEYIYSESEGGGVHTSGLTMVNCSVLGNTSTASAYVSFSMPQAYILTVLSLGGGIYSQKAAVGQNTIVSGNSAQGATPAYGWSATTIGIAGGGYFFAGARAALTNCILAYNTPEALYAGANGADLLNCTLAFNGTQGIRAENNATAVRNSIVWGSSAGQVAGTTNVSYSAIQGGFSGVGNTAYNPLLTAPTLGDFHLLEGSPCIDAGDPAAPYNDVAFPPSLGGVRNDMGAYGGPGASGWIEGIAGNAPEITTPLQSQSGYLGGTATFNVVATGAQPLDYHWFFNDRPVAAPNSSTLTLSHLEEANAGRYAVVVSNVFGSVTSAPVQLVIYEARVDLKLYAGLDIAGQAGQTFVLSYSTNMDSGDWTALATNTMSASGWFFLDMDSPGKPKRFYKVTLQR